MQKSNEKHIKEAMNAFFKQYHLQPKIHQVKVKEIWGKVMGKMVDRYTSNIKLYDGVLTIYLNSAPLKNELHFTREQIIKRLNEELGEPVIKEIRIS